jgi:hypothetical protein
VTTLRRRTAVVATSTLALIGALALPAAAGTTLHAGCTVADDDYYASDPGEVTLEYPHADKAMKVEPGAGRISGALTTSSPTGGREDCGIDGGFTDTVTVLPGTSGKAAGDSALATATLRFTGSIEVGGDGTSHDATADLDGSFRITGRGTSEDDGVDTRAWSNIELYAQTTRSGGYTYSPYRKVATHAAKGAPAVIDVYERSDGLTALAFTAEPTTVTFPVVVGEQLDVAMHLTLFSGATTDGSGKADVEVFQVELDGVDGVVLDRGDAPQEQPEQDVTPLDLLQQARDALAGYELGKGIANSLDVKLRHAIDELVAGGDACDELASFQAHLAAQRGKHVTDAQADELAAVVAEAQDLLGC